MEPLQEMQRLLSSSTKTDLTSLLNTHIETICYFIKTEEKASKIIVSYLNNLLNIPTKRDNTLLLLSKLLPHMPPSIVKENAPTWYTITVNSDQCNLIKFGILHQLIKICSGSVDFDRFLLGGLSKTIESCTSVKSDDSRILAALDCLITCLKTYPGPLGPMKPKIEGYLFNYLISDSDRAIVMKVGIAAHYLQQIGGGGVGGATHKINWSNHFGKLIASLHETYDDFFKDTQEFVDYEIPQVIPYNLNKDKTENSLCNIPIFLDSMLLVQFPVEKVVNITRFLELIERGLSVNVYKNYSPAVISGFAEELYKHQTDLLYLLRSLMACYNQDLLPLANRITKILMDALERTKETYFLHRCEYPTAILKVLRYWMDILGNKIHVATQNKLVSFICTEVTPAESNVVLCLESPSKTKAKKLAASMNAEKETVASMDAKVKMCLEVLATGKCLFESCVLDLDVDLERRMFDRISGLLLKIEGGRDLIPYTDQRCVLALYEFYVSFFVQPCYRIEPCVPIAINLLSRTHDYNGDNCIRKVCSKGINLLEALCQSAFPSMTLAREKKKVAMVSDEVIKVKDTMSVDRFSSPSSSSNNPKVRILDMVIIKEADQTLHQRNKVQIFSEAQDSKQISSTLAEIDHEIVTINVDNSKSDSDLDSDRETDIMDCDNIIEKLSSDDDEEAMTNSFKDITEID